MYLQPYPTFKGRPQAAELLQYTGRCVQLAHATQQLGDCLQRVRPAAPAPAFACPALLEWLRRQWQARARNFPDVQSMTGGGGDDKGRTWSASTHARNCHRARPACHGRLRVGVSQRPAAWRHAHVRLCIKFDSMHARVSVVQRLARAP